ncbi:MAG: beta-ketoacyl synthase N-terminal-like domain-containing protein [Verrucomicrobiota bacterium]
MPENLRAKVAIAGCGVISAVGCGTESLLKALRENTSGLRPSARFDSPRFQSAVVGAAPRIGNFFDENPAYELAHEALRQTRKSSQTLLEKIPATRVGLVLSTTKANMGALDLLLENKPCSEMARRHLQADRLARDLAEAHGAAGTIQTVSVACVSGLIALQQGAKLIQRGGVDAVFVVGVDHLSAFVVAGFTALKALDPAGARPFDQHRAGLSPGEAGACLLLVNEKFISRPAIFIQGWGGTNDANHMTGPSRDGGGLAAAIRLALAAADLSADKIDYINAHGTGTLYNDAMESAALRTVFGDDSPPVSGLKGMLGHTLGAAGVIETIACVQAMQNDFLPGTPRLEVPAENAPPALLKQPRFGVRLQNVLKLNVGFGGINGAIVLSHE